MIQEENDKKIVVVLFYVQKMNTSLLNVMEQYKPASAISLEESDELVESKKDAKILENGTIYG